jgi:hypothetical protein
MLLEDNPEEDSLLEDASEDDLKALLFFTRRLKWDEGHYQHKLTEKIRAAEGSEKDFYNSFKEDSIHRVKQLALVEARLEAIRKEQEFRCPALPH